MVLEVNGGASGVSDANNSGGFLGGAYIGAPSAPTVTPSASGGTVAAATYYVVITYTDGLGDTVISGQTAVTTSGATASFTITSPGASTGALTWNAYCGTTTGGPYFPQGTGLTIGSNRVVTVTPPTSGTQPRGVDYSLSGTRQVVIDNSTITATTAGANSNVLTFTLGHTAVGAEVGNTLRTTNGTNINLGDYQITAITPTTWTVAGAQNLTTAGGAGSAIVGGMGGCHATPGQAAAFAITGNTIFEKNGSYTWANGTVNTAGNKVSLSGVSFIGYSTNRYPGNTDTQPVNDAGAASMTMLAISGNGQTIENLSFTNSAARASVTAFSSSTNGAMRLQNLSISACATPLSFSGFTGIVDNIYMTGCGAIAGSAFQFYKRCVSINATGNAFGQGIAGNEYDECAAITPVGTGFTLTTSGAIRNCIVDAAGSHGVGSTANNGIIENTICYGCTGSGVSVSGSTGILLYNVACGGNATNFDANLASYQKINTATPTSNPWVNSAGGNYALNTTAGAGALCRQLGIPGTWPGLSTTGYRSIGIAEPAAIVPGGTPHLAGRGGGLAG